MATNNKDLAASIVELLGGSSNISTALHCVTRLRFNLRDGSLAKLDDIRQLKGVLGAQIKDGQYQIIIGPNVNRVYDEVVPLLDSSAALTTSFSAFLGISEPALFTVQVPNKTPLIAAMIANGIGGALTGVLGAKCYAFVMPGITSLPTYANGGAFNLLMMVVCIASTFVIAAILSFILGGKLANKH